MLCRKCGELMRLDNEEPPIKGVYKYWYHCDACELDGCIDEITGEYWWSDEPLPF